MTGGRPNENQEWVSARVDAWVETYKKSMLGPVILGVVARHPQLTVSTVAEQVARETGWQITERGLYRTLKRLEDSGLLTSTEVAAARTGAKRKQIRLTDLGSEFLAGVTENLIDLPPSGS
ncbi:PadR family transcriptional regulator [Nesterenkonia halotolerans]|uniref:DNA-binding PadR family transcriptional regulator n=1 Tax=Nesterenkonia halotolerans TaxID=225325 RepID=A0ABR9J647_9MICC|nr:PadR family transcriptional regulator [Nesterenkonia halotolerans]MBE1514076.1 DNA-binding PadR family transcriptional regulator [Nesterenkonia halotolerans]